MATSLPSLVSETYNPNCEAAITDQIQLELYAAYVYGSVAFYFDKMPSKPFAQFFREQSGKERATADRLIQLVNQRGSNTPSCDFSSNHSIVWGNSLKVLESTLCLSMKVKQSLYNLHQLATEKKDTLLCNFLESHCLQEQLKFNKELEDHISSLRKMGAPESSPAEHHCGKLLLDDSKD